MRRSGKGKRSSKVAAWKAVTGPISTNAVSRATLPARRRVTGQAACERSRCAGWAIRSSKRSAQKRNTSRKPAGSTTSSSITSSQSWPGAGWAASWALRFSNLPRPGAAGAMANSTSWRERASSAREASISPSSSGRSTPATSTRRRGGRVRAARARPARRPESASRASSSVSWRPSSVAWRPPTVPLRPVRKSGPGAGAGSSASATRPAEWAAMTSPLPQRRRAVCQRQPASTRSSRSRVGGSPRRASKRRELRPRAFAARASARSVVSGRARRWSRPAAAT